MRATGTVAIVAILSSAIGASAFGCSSSDSAPTNSGGDAGADAAESTRLQLAPGDVAEVTMEGGRAALRLATPEGTETFTLVLGSTEFTNGSDPTDYAVSGDPIETPSGASILTGCSITSDAWKDKQLAPEAEPTGTAPLVGDTRQLDVLVGTSAQTITAKVAAVGKRSIVWTDDTNGTTIDQAFMDEFVTAFDDTILPRARTVFGTESDIDQNGRVGLVFTPLTKDNAVAFFYSCDLQNSQSCPSTNSGEFLYLTPPADIAPPYNTPNAIKEILAHELGHLVHYNHKVLRSQLPKWPDGSYMIESIGGFAQDVIGYQSGNLYVAKAGLDGIDQFSLSDTFGAGAYDKSRDGLLRGASYLFVRFIYDRAGGDAIDQAGMIENTGGPAFFDALLDGPDSVHDAMEKVANTTAADVAMDFYTALAMSNQDKNGHAAATNACFAYAPTSTDPVTGKQRGANLFAEFHGQGMKGAKTQELAAADGKLRMGGVELLTVQATADQPETQLTVTAAPKALPRLRIARTK